MTSADLQKYKHVQSLAKETIDFLKSFICEGVTEKEIREAAENFLHEKDVKSFWYYGLGAFVLVGERTTISISGREYLATDTKVQNNDLISVDLSPEIDNFWGDFARTFVVENGKVIDGEQSKFPEIVEGIKAEKTLHREFRLLAQADMSFEEIYTKINTLIDELGFENLDFNKNLGHSIVKQKDDRVYIKAGNATLLGSVDLLTFEPHIRKKNGKYGFKHEDIYYFEGGRLQVL
ncbi:MAG: M24 family metallopeptidase [Candidatus Gracilibacteria bacterium]|jgi:methionine aminopeptidase